MFLHRLIDCEMEARPFCLVWGCLLGASQHVVINSSLACLHGQAAALGTYVLFPSASPFLPAPPFHLGEKVLFPLTSPDTLACR